ncbi:hypothetical protein SERLA73DRAFT_176640 [Serpula lacrymans var. lacrymans S7.3]|uniref:Uncharacterized protein n=1 Tax=Serpula lacrymans var. lacrymans (strain S7.3) TaxID=936435 RepID=F8PND8_SERL3|nr:hypothetical protein SERLA73DRAFT_176640 [Serpula lacrymans var. lacrymans S7.3]
MLWQCREKYIYIHDTRHRNKQRNQIYHGFDYRHNASIIERLSDQVTKPSMMDELFSLIRRRGDFLGRADLTKLIF